MTMAMALTGLIVELLEADATLQARGIRAFVQPPPLLQFPYILLGPVQSQDWSAQGVTAQSHMLHLAIWTRDTPLTLLEELQNAVQNLMQQLPVRHGAYNIGCATLLLGETRHDAATQVTSWQADYRIRTLEIKG